MKKFLHFWFAIIFVLLLPDFCTSQPAKANGLYVVEPAGAFTGYESDGMRNGIVTRIFDTIFGRTSFRLKVPFAVLALDSTRWVVLDQGLQAVIFVDHRRKRQKIILGPKGIRFPSLIAVTWDGKRYVYFTDSNLGRIFRFSVGKLKLEVVNQDSVLHQPTGIAFSAKEQCLWVVETKKHRLVKLSPDGKILAAVGRRGTEPGEFNYPMAVATDSAGRIYVIDAMNFRIQILDPRGNVVRVFGEAGDATGYFSRPKGIAVDHYGHIYVTDVLFHTVQIFGEDGSFLYNFGNQGHSLGQFWMPSGIYVDEANRIYVADTYNSRVQVFRLWRRSDEQ